MTDDRRLIEDYLPIQAISAEASREKSIRKGHISTLHLWWARRPLVACRAAVYGALVPASRFRPESGPEEKRASLARANAAKFVERLCKYPPVPAAIAEAQRHILEAHADRLRQETEKPVTVEDILAGRAPRPKVLDMFAEGGAIPLEALRLGCEAYALDLNPVAHIIELCTLVYPQKYGKPDPTATGCARDGTWAGLAEEVRYWGEWVLKKVKAEIGDLYPLIPDPEFKGRRGEKDARLFGTGDEVPPGYLVPVAYLWTRTVTCKNPNCSGQVPLARQYWLAKKANRRIGLTAEFDRSTRKASFAVVANADFDANIGSRASSTECPYCRTALDSQYVRESGRQRGYGLLPLAVCATPPLGRGKTYLPALSSHSRFPSDDTLMARASQLAQTLGTTLPRETVPPTGNAGLATGISFLYGMTSFQDMFTPRQLVALLTFCRAIRAVFDQLKLQGTTLEVARAICAYQVLTLGKLASLNCSLTRWKPDAELPVDAFGFQRFQMVWDFAEANPISGFGSSWQSQLERVLSGLETVSVDTQGASVLRGTATSLEFASETFDAVVTDPPYYDNVSYSELSDFFYVWMKRAIGRLWPQHFASDLTPKKEEIVAAAYRQGGSASSARARYEHMLEAAWKEAYRIIKPRGSLVCVYAHKTTVGWAVLVDSLRKTGFSVEEAWPLQSEMAARVSHQEDAALASSIFIVARKREYSAGVGNYETAVRPELEQIVRERVATLWDMGVSGADLVIACVGAGLRAFTRFARVQYANGEPVPAERYLGEVEAVVLDQILARLSREVGGNSGRHSLAGVDPATRFYTLWRYTYRTADLDAGEAIVFANGTHVELDGVGGLSSGPRPLIEKKKGKYRLRDYVERGEDEKLGLPRENGEPAPLVDALHRTLWLMERGPGKLAEFLREAQPNREQMRLVAQALAGPALKGGELSDVSPSGELGALAKLTANWRSVVEEAAMTPAERDERRTGQKHLDFGGRHQ